MRELDGPNLAGRLGGQYEALYVHLKKTSRIDDGLPHAATKQQLVGGLLNGAIRRRRWRRLGKAAELVKTGGAIAASQLDQRNRWPSAEQLGLPDSAFAPDEDRPGLVLLDLRQLRQRGPSVVVPAAGQFTRTPGIGDPSRNAMQALYDSITIKPKTPRLRSASAPQRRAVGSDGAGLSRKTAWSHRWPTRQWRTTVLARKWLPTWRKESNARAMASRSQGHGDFGGGCKQVEARLDSSLLSVVPSGPR
jgi:hypothetical protein